MANTATAVPLKKENGAKEKAALEQEFDVAKKYVFQLAAQTMPLEKPVYDARTNRPLPHKPFKPYQNLIMTSQIVWNGGRVGIRYYDGCESIFVSEQPREKDVVDQLIQSTRRRGFNEGKLIVDGYDKMLLLYLNICSWNVESPFRTSTANQIFVCVNGDKAATAESERLDKIEEALKLAKEATVEKMLVHADYLGVTMTDYDSGHVLSEKEIRTAYRKRASRDPIKFIESFGNRTLEIKYFVNKAWEKGLINNKLNSNKAAWSHSNTVICDIYGLKSSEAICQRLFEFSQSEEGDDFEIQLKAVMEKK